VREVTQAYRRLREQVEKVGGFEQEIAAIHAAEEAADFAYVEENLPTSLASASDGIRRMSAIVRAMKEFAHPDSKESDYADLNRAIEATLTIARNEYKYVADVEMELGPLPLVHLPHRRAQPGLLEPRDQCGSRHRRSHCRRGGPGPNLRPQPGKWTSPR